MHLYNETLTWVNAERRARGLGPALPYLPPGSPGDCETCPVALALEGALVDGYDVEYPGPAFDRVVNLPAAVREFIVRFDGGGYPELLS